MLCFDQLPQEGATDARIKVSVFGRIDIDVGTGK
jgi:hypothetical protein